MAEIPKQNFLFIIPVTRVTDQFCSGYSVKTGVISMFTLILLIDVYSLFYGSYEIIGPINYYIAFFLNLADFLIFS
jgi:hypothetical protein